MSTDKTPDQFPKRAKEAGEPEPEQTPHVEEDPKGDASSRLEGSREPSEDEEKRRVAEKLRERGQGS